MIHICWVLTKGRRGPGCVAGESEGCPGVHWTCCQAVTGPTTHKKDATDGDFAARPAAGRCSSQNIPALVPHDHPSTQPRFLKPRRPHDPINLAPFARFGGASVPRERSTAPAESSTRAQGCGRGVLATGVQLNGYWKRLAKANDYVGYPLVAAVATPPPTLALWVHQQPLVCNADWPASSAHADVHAKCLQRCTVSLSSFRAALAGGNAAIAAEPTRAATRMK